MGGGGRCYILSTSWINGFPPTSLRSNIFYTVNHIKITLRADILLFPVCDAHNSKCSLWEIAGGGGWKKKSRRLTRERKPTSLLVNHERTGRPRRALLFAHAIPVSVPYALLFTHDPSKPDGRQSRNGILTETKQNLANITTPLQPPVLYGEKYDACHTRDSYI